MLIREVIEKRLTMYEHNEKHQPPKPENGLGGSGAMRDPLVGNEFPEQNASQSQRSLPDRDPLQRTLYDESYIEKMSPQERMLMEEEDEEQ